ncbi:glycosyltransferase [Corynebacterium sp. NML130628]|uniref:glycosyltransferase family protein n=1 Tax=Corynebacterium sp. NML130628 TaxID=1906333 RepID=UPI002100B683|nr:glycosyltransferase [Corynebacterium sp. NML130628]
MIRQLKHGNTNYVLARISSEVHRLVNQVVPLNRSSLQRITFFLQSDSSLFDPLGSKTFKQNAYNLPTPQIAAAVILDDFSMFCWKNEFQVVSPTPDNWKQVFEGTSIDFLFVESAHAGNGGAWRSRLNKTDSADPTLSEMLAWCNEHNVPTVFWNKEDPAHFDDFITTASAFDYIFTTDSDVIERYREIAPEAVVGVMPFAAQPAIHNPARNQPNMPGIRDKRWQRGDIAFAGTYFNHKYPERRQQLDLLLEAAAASASKNGFNFCIFSRLGNVDKRYRFPKQMRRYIVGSLPPERMLSANKEHKVFLNVNSVVTSPSMCARRLFELPASGAAVVTTPSPATTNFFSPDALAEVQSVEEATATITTLINSPEYREKMVHRAQRTIWNQHCYRHRAEQLFTAIGLQTPSRPSGLVSVISSSNRPENVIHVLTQFARQSIEDRELILITHGYELKQARLHELCLDLSIDPSTVTQLEAPQSWSLGNCLNAAVSQSSGDFIAKFDDDDYYLPHYLEDMRNAVKYSDADLVGKQAAYAYVEGSNALVLRRPNQEHLWTNFVAGPTLFGPRETFEHHPFEDRTTGEDTAFLKSIIAANERIYSTDRFNFIQVRGDNHTWKLSDAEFIAQGEVRSFGLNETHVEA